MLNELQHIRGAVYVPARAFNAWQMWQAYDDAVIRRDFGYARRLNLNALRLWLSYEYWLQSPARMEERVDDLLSAADRQGLRVMAVLFERCGVDPTPEALADRDPRSAVCVRSPHPRIVEDPAQWDRPIEFVRWFMRRFGARDGRLLAVEIVNEPQSFAEHRFARAMFSEAAALRGDVPLTLGSLHFEDSRLYQDLGLDILQAHENFHRSEEIFRRRLQRFVETQDLLNRPVMVTEWQRLRPGGSGWKDEPVSAEEWQPAYATMAPILAEYPLGSFFWSLMVKLAYLPVQRGKGTLNGVFHEDGSVWSLADARAIARDPSFQAPERPEWPAWAAGAPRSP